MKFTFSDENKRWWDSLGDDSMITAGRLENHQPFGELSQSDHESNETRIVLGQLIHMLRSRDGLSIEDYAHETDLDIGEILLIERDPSHVPDPRTVYEIATYHNFVVAKLMNLAGINKSRHGETISDGLKFAARSEAPEKLTKEQLHVLEEFVHVLGCRD